jgi:hypothetical protein
MTNTRMSATSVAAVASSAVASATGGSNNNGGTENDSSWGDQCMICPVKLNKHGRTVPNVGPLNLFTCFGIRIEAERAWYVIRGASLLSSAFSSFM